MTEPKSLGQVAMEAFFKECREDHPGIDPKWDDSDDKSCWESSAQAVITAYLDAELDPKEQCN